MSETKVNIMTPKALSMAPTGDRVKAFHHESGADGVIFQQTRALAPFYRMSAGAREVTGAVALSFAPNLYETANRLHSRLTNPEAHANISRGEALASGLENVAQLLGMPATNSALGKLPVLGEDTFAILGTSQARHLGEYRDHAPRQLLRFEPEVVNALDRIARRTEGTKEASFEERIVDTVAILGGQVLVDPLNLKRNVLSHLQDGSAETPPVPMERIGEALARAGLVGGIGVTIDRDLPGTAGQEAIALVASRERTLEALSNTVQWLNGFGKSNMPRPLFITGNIKRESAGEIVDGVRRAVAAA